MQKIIVIPGDGIGPEVTEEALTTLQALGADLEFTVLDRINADRWLREGVALTDDELELVRDTGTVLFGAVGDPRVTSTDYARGVLLRLRTELDLFVNYRPAVLLDDRLSPLRDESRRGIDCVVVRENTEGLYSGVGGILRGGTPDEVAVDQEMSTYLGVSRVVEYAYGIARRSVCVVDKSNAVPFGGRLWQRVRREAAARHPELESSHLYVDAAAMKLVNDPTSFDVIVANNSYGDILSDLTAELAGGLGTAASANINPLTGVGLYEPVHGSAPDIVGKGLANPAGAVLSAALMLRDRGLKSEAQALEQAVRRTIAEYRCTPDLGGTLTTRQAGEAIRAALV
ncbi:isocitrate/isopropylmalate dehydrogenase family protein [Kitasatospora sp. NPDC018619]|uniref:isocitrate/isopropylmalate dehydrogenase family protein n=1 Tax=unclassified Kitasatospora TaxID=2633591 RepID=UPI0037BBE76E